MDFYTATINKWQNLLHDDEMKLIIIASMKWLVDNNKAAVHSFVVMPNHFHVLWTQLDPNYAIGANLKSFTGSLFRNYLMKNNPKLLGNYISTQRDRTYLFWKRRSKLISMCTREIAHQKLEYIHNNPLQEKWKLAEKQEYYPYSSSSFYLLEDNRFPFLSRYEDWI